MTVATSGRPPSSSPADSRFGLALDTQTVWLGPVALRTSANYANYVAYGLHEIAHLLLAPPLVFDPVERVCESYLIFAWERAALRVLPRYTHTAVVVYQTGTPIHGGLADWGELSETNRTKLLRRATMRLRRLGVVNADGALTFVRPNWNVLGRRDLLGHVYS
jgi:hypothetical protein